MKSPPRGLEWPFVVAFLLAVGGSTLLSITEISWAPAVWAVACMGGYLAHTWVRSPALLATENYADNFYYLGFLLTLTALVIVLVQLGDPSDLQNGLFKTVLSQFGLALTTTLVGLAGRTFLMMRGVGEQETLEKAQASLEDSYDDLTRALSRITNRVDTFSGRFETSLEASLETVDGSVRRFKKIIDQASDQFDPALARLVELSDAIGESVGGVKTAAASISESLSGIPEGLEGSIERIEEQTTDTLVRVGDLADSSAGLLVGVQSQLERVFQELQVSLSSFRQQVAGVATALQSLPNQIEGAGTAASEKIADTQRSVQEFYRQLDALVPALRNVSNALVTESEGVKDTLAEWGKNAEALATLQSRMVREAEGTTRTIKQVRDEAAAAFDLLIDRLEGSDGTSVG